jgi:DNA-binding beta-propeller fold protein YncE
LRASTDDNFRGRKLNNGGMIFSSALTYISSSIKAWPALQQVKLVSISPPQIYLTSLSKLFTLQASPYKRRLKHGSSKTTILMLSIRAKAALFNKIISCSCCCAVILLVACSDRPRLNPLDPQNPNTLGKPTGLSAISVRDTVTLQWDQLDVRDLSGFHIYRRSEGELRFSLLTPAPPNANSFREFGVNFGVLQTYRISAVAANFESPLSDSVAITPGPTFSWVADASSGELIKLTHDGVHEITRTRAFGRPFRLQIDARRGYVWVLDRFGGEFGRIDVTGRRTTSNRRVSGPADLAVDNADGSVWVADSLANGLMKFDSAGALIKSLENYKKISALAVHPATAELWALDRASLRVLIFSRAGELRRTLSVALQRPTDIDIDARTGKAWIADGNRVLQLDARGEQEQISSPFRLAYRVAADEISGGCWLIDYSTAIRGSNIVKLNPAGEALFTNTGFDIPENLAANPFDGVCLVADYGNGRIVRIASDGRVLGTYERVFSPVDVDTAQ